MTSSNPGRAEQAPVSGDILDLQGLTRRFGNITAVDSVDLTVRRGELFSLLGGSGCGKSTLLRMIAGLETPDSGRLLIDGQDMTNIPPYERPVNMVFQSYALFPHMTVTQNVAYGLRQEGMARGERDERVYEMLQLVDMQDLAERRPDQLSGGQRQRVALARGLAKRPRILLLDEPLGALDRKLRERTQFELVKLQNRIGTTFILVTHDQEEAMTMSDRIAVMRAGRIQQIGAPRQIYAYPNSRYVADFVGTANLLPGEVMAKTDGIAQIRLSDTGILVHVSAATPVKQGDQVTAMVRPEKLRATADRNSVLGEANLLSGVVEDIAYLGDMSIYHVQVSGGPRIQVAQANRRHTGEAPVTWGDTIHLTWHPEDGVVLTT